MLAFLLKVVCKRLPVNRIKQIKYLDIVLFLWIFIFTAHVHCLFQRGVFEIFRYPLQQRKSATDTAISSHVINLLMKHLSIPLTHLVLCNVAK